MNTTIDDNIYKSKDTTHTLCLLVGCGLVIDGVYYYIFICG